MSKIFISHSSRDNFEAQALADWLAAEGWADIFLDLDPERGIAAGERWERKLHEASQRCEAVIFLVSKNWLSSDWCGKEFSLARGLNKKLFAVIIEPGLGIGALPAAFTGTWQATDLCAGQDLKLFPTTLPGSHEEKHIAFSQAGLRRLKSGLEKAGLDPKFFAWPPASEPDRAPYRGLKPLEDADAGIFFGREAPIIEAMDRLRGLRRAAAPRLLVILGASGAGKSSFLRAGLMPRLDRDDRNFLPLPVIRPERAALYGDNGLLGALEKALPHLARADIRAAIEGGAETLRPLLAGFVAKRVESMLVEGEAEKPPAVVIAIDQAEELFRAEGSGEGTGLLTLLRDLTSEDRPAVIALFAIRSDAYDALEHAKPLEGLAQSTLPLLPMPRGAYKDVIEGPARRYVEAGHPLSIEPQLTQKLLQDLDQGGASDALPLLAFTLEQLFREYRGAGALKLAHYEALGGLRGVIEAAVERAFVRADADPRIPRDRKAREALLRRGLIPWLAGIDPDTKSPRRNLARLSDIPAEAVPLIDLLIEERLLSCDRVIATDEQDQRLTTIEPTHEALLRQWGLLQGWLEEDFGRLTVLEGVKRAGRDWDANDRAEAWLAHQGQRLTEAQALDERADIAAKLDAVDRAYLAQCAAKQEALLAEAAKRAQEREEEQLRQVRDARRITQRTRIGLGVALMLAAIAAAVGFYALAEKTIAENQALNAELQTIEARSQRDAAAAAEMKAIEQEKIANEQRDLAALAEKKAFESETEAKSQRDSAVASENRAHDKEAEAQNNQAAALIALSNAALPTSPEHAAKLVLAAWPITIHAQTNLSTNALSALGAAVLQMHERRILSGHSGSVSRAIFSPDGSRLVTSSMDGTARLWDTKTGLAFATLTGHSDTVNNAVFSLDGLRVATSSDDKTARLWDAKTGKLIAVLSGHTGFVKSANFSPDGTRVVTSSYDRSARLWDAKTGQILAVLSGHTGFVTNAIFSPDGTRVVTSSSDKTARLWDGRTGQYLTVLSGHTEEISAANFSPDSARVITASMDKTARLWDVKTGHLITTFSGHTEAVSSALISPDSMRVVTASDDKTARLWDAKTGHLTAVLYGHLASVGCARFSADSLRVVTASDDKTARLWDANSGQLIAVFSGHAKTVNDTSFSPDGTLVVTVSDDETTRLWDVETARVLAILNGHTDFVQSISFSHDSSHIVTSSWDETARIWDTKTGGCIAILKGHGDRLLGAKFSPDGTRLVTSSDDGTARLWDAVTGRPLAVLGGHKNVVSSATFSTDNSYVATGSDDGTARVWDAKTGQVVAILAGHTDKVWSVTFSPDSALVVTTSEDHTARLWDSRTGQSIATLNGHTDLVNSAEFSPDGTRLVTASFDKTARLWDTKTWGAIAVLNGHTGYVTSADFSPDGARVVTSSWDHTARIWDAKSGVPISVLKGHSDDVNLAVFSPDSARILTASKDKTARLWDATTGQPIAVLSGHSGSVLDVGFSPDGTRAVTASDDKTARIWDIGSIPKGDIFEIACAWLPDPNLSDLAVNYSFSNLPPICTGHEETSAEQVQ